MTDPRTTPDSPPNAATPAATIGGGAEQALYVLTGTCILCHAEDASPGFQTCERCWQMAWRTRSADSFDAVVRDIREWQQLAFPDSTAQSCANHLLKEAHELVAAPNDGEEMADIVFLVVDCATRAGVDLVGAMQRKLEKNKRRTWKSRDPVTGIVEHASEGSAAGTSEGPAHA